MNITQLSISIWTAALAGALAVLLVLTSYFILEPVVSRAQSANEIFTVQQTITTEISFVASTSVNNMAPALSGVTGGYATGTAQAAVLTNNQTGFNMTIDFGSTTQTNDAMQGDTNGGYISNFDIGATTTPLYTFDDPLASQAAEFAYTVNASDTADIHSNFLSNGTNCGIEGGSYEANNCWMAPSTTNAYLIIDRDTATPSGSGSTTTVQFKVAVPSNPNPALPNDTYTATVTLTASVNS